MKKNKEKAFKWIYSLPEDPSFDWMRKEIAQVFKISVCNNCLGSGAQDSGGVTPQDTFISITCRQCDGTGVDSAS